MISLTGSQDVQYIDAMLTNKAAEERENTALVILKSGRLTGKDNSVKMLNREPIEEEKDEEEESQESLEEESDFLELNEATQKVTKEVQLDDNPPKVVEQNEDEYQFVNRPTSLVFKSKAGKAINLDEKRSHRTEGAQDWLSQSSGGCKGGSTLEF